MKNGFKWPECDNKFSETFTQWIFTQNHTQETKRLCKRMFIFGKWMKIGLGLSCKTIKNGKEELWMLFFFVYQKTTKSSTSTNTLCIFNSISSYFTFHSKVRYVTKNLLHTHSDIRKSKLRMNVVRCGGIWMTVINLLNGQ